MLHKNLIQPNSIVVIGGSDNIHSPGGRVLKNLIDHNFNGDLFVVNPKKNNVQGIKSYKDLHQLPEIDSEQEIDFDDKLNPVIRQNFTNFEKRIFRAG